MSEVKPNKIQRRTDQALFNIQTTITILWPLYKLTCRLFAYGPADAPAIPKPHLLPHLNADWFYLSVPAYWYWYGYLSGARWRLAYGPADATATHCLMLQ